MTAIRSIVSYLKRFPTSARLWIFVLFSVAPVSSAWAIVLDWPLGDSIGNVIVPGYRIHVLQNYANRGLRGNRPHAGVDLIYTNRANAGAPVYAAADGRITFRGNVNYPGWVMVIEHTTPSGEKIYTQYGHLNAVSLSEGAIVKKGDAIGTLRDQGDNTHLHFEVRTLAEIHGSAWGPGYGSPHLEPHQEGWLDPVHFLFQHRAPCTVEAVSRLELAVRDRPTDTGLSMGSLPQGSRIPALDVAPDSVEAGSWWYKVPQGSGFGYVKGFDLQHWESDIYVGEFARNCEHYLVGYHRASSSLTTTVYVRNNRVIHNPVKVEILDSAGSVVRSIERELAPNQTLAFNPSNNVIGGTAVVTAERGEDIAAVARILYTSGRSNATFEAAQYPSPTQNVPVVHRNNFGWYNKILIFNPDTSRHMNIRVSFTGASQLCTSSATLGPRRTMTVNTRGLDCLPPGYRGRATVSAKVAGTDKPGLAAVTSFQERQSGATIQSLMAAAVSQRTGKQLYVPLIQNNNFGYLAGIGAEKGVGNGALQATYREGSGSLCLHEFFNGWPVIQAPIPRTTNLCGSVLSAILTGLENVDHIYTQLNQLQGDQSSSYPAIARPTTRAYVPFLTGGSAASGIQIQNASGRVATIEIHFYDTLGNRVGSAIQRTIPPRGTMTVVSGIPTGARSATVQSNTEVAVIVNNLIGNSGDVLMDYAAPNGH